MTRTFAIAAILALTSLSAIAEPLSVQVHDAAVKVCAAKYAGNQPAFYYGMLTRACADRVSVLAMRRIAAQAEAKTRASTAALVAN